MSPNEEGLSNAVYRSVCSVSALKNRYFSRHVQRARRSLPLLLLVLPPPFVHRAPKVNPGLSHDCQIVPIFRRRRAITSPYGNPENGPADFPGRSKLSFVAKSKVSDTKQEIASCLPLFAGLRRTIDTPS